MKLKQQLLKFIYPALMSAGKLFGMRSRTVRNVTAALPAASFYDLVLEANDGRKISFNDFRGKNVLLVNTASGCGYTNQFAELDQLDKLYPNLVVLGFPSNDFKEQEKLSDDEIAQFCKVNFGVSFLLAKKGIVIKNNGQNEVFDWLSDSAKNGWNDLAPEWNFSKYLVNKKGVLMSYFGPGVEPLSREVRNTIET